jgi:hypothetical protein
MRQRLAELADEMQNIFPNGKGVIVFELKSPDFYSLKKEFNINTNDKQFKLDISGTEIILILDELLNDEINKS